MSNSKLEPCRVCHKDDRLLEKHWKGFFVVCLYCFERTDRLSTAAIARDAWNAQCDPVTANFLNALMSEC